MQHPTMTLDEALDSYWSAAYAEGARGATHDTEDGMAQTALAAVNSCVRMLRADAERYRWLRSRIPGATYRIMGVIYSEGGDGVDYAIDAAMMSHKGTEFRGALGALDSKDKLAWSVPNAKLSRAP